MTHRIATIIACAGLAAAACTNAPPEPPSDPSTGASIATVTAAPQTACHAAGGACVFVTGCARRAPSDSQDCVPPGASAPYVCCLSVDADTLR